MAQPEAGRGVLLTTEAGWLLALVPAPAQPAEGSVGQSARWRQQQQQQQQGQQAAWSKVLRATCVNAEGYGDLDEATRAMTIAKTTLRGAGGGGGGGAVVGPPLRDTLLMAVEVGSGISMLSFDCSLSDAGEIAYEMHKGAQTDDMAEDVVKGSLDVKAALHIYIYMYIYVYICMCMCVTCACTCTGTLHMCWCRVLCTVI